jgi:hypothetical protein
MTVLATQNLLASMCTTIYQNLGGIGVTPNESNRPESNGPSTGVTLTKFVYGLNPMRTHWIRHFWIASGGRALASDGLLLLPTLTPIAQKPASFKSPLSIISLRDVLCLRGAPYPHT